MHAETTWSTGHNARTLIKYDDFRVVLTALQASARVPTHKTEGRISIHVLSGHVQVKASERTFSLRPGGLLALDQGVPHDIEALEESAFLLTLAWPAIGLYVIFIIAPSIAGIGYSFTDWSAYTDDLNFVGWENFERIFANTSLQPWLTWILNSVIVSSMFPRTIRV